jgi:hypothetical protein
MRSGLRNGGHLGSDYHGPERQGKNQLHWHIILTAMTHIRLALRSLTRAPGFAVAAVATLALGIGASAAVFTLVHAVILKPLPFRDPARLLAVWDTYLPQFARIGVSPTEFDAWSRETALFEGSEPRRSLGARLGGRRAADHRGRGVLLSRATFGVGGSLDGAALGVNQALRILDEAQYAIA